jgi:phosphatidylinositol phospholipase C, delta
MEVHEKMAKELLHHNRHYMMRAYPSGFRVRSSNLEPAVFWRKGIQIVALNWQKCDEGMMLNEGMFAGTGGYVLKPEGYRSLPAPLPNPARAAEPGAAPQAVAAKHYILDLKIEVLAAQSLPLPEGHKDPAAFHPYVKVELHVEESAEREPPSKSNNGGVPADGKEKEGEHKRKTKSLKGRDPDYQGQTLSFDKIPGVVPELTFVRFTVRDAEWVQDVFAAWACVRLDRLKEGYRFVHLLDMKGVQSEGVLLVKITKTLT